jgi:hypothetical protein
MVAVEVGGVHGGSGWGGVGIGHALVSLVAFRPACITLRGDSRNAIVGRGKIRAGLQDHQAKLDLECGLHGTANRVVAA